MAKVFAIKEHGRHDETEIILMELLAKHRRGELTGLMHFTVDTDGTTSVGVAGGFADRLQFAAYTLVKGLDSISDKIVDSGTAGFSQSATIHEHLQRKSR